MRIRVTTRADLFEESKRQHIERGYRIEDERPIPVNGLCSFVAVAEIPGSDQMGSRLRSDMNGPRLFPASRGDDVQEHEAAAQTKVWLRSASANTQPTGACARA
jgi:hypothetical protein